MPPTVATGATSSPWHRACARTGRPALPPECTRLAVVPGAPLPSRNPAAAAAGADLPHRLGARARDRARLRGRGVLVLSAQSRPGAGAGGAGALATPRHREGERDARPTARRRDAELTERDGEVSVTAHATAWAPAKEA